MRSVDLLRLFPRQRRRHPAAAPAGASLAGLPFLTDVFGPDARIIVEAGFGADLTGDPGYWPWYDITADMRHANGQGIKISPMGRSDETSLAQPAGCAFELDNTSGDYSKGPQSKWYPYIRRNTPIRVRLTIDGSSWYTRFQGQANGWTPSWDTSCNLAVVTVSASGKLRQLQQGKSPQRSVLARSTIASRPSLYLPFEDKVRSTTAASALSGGEPMLVNPLATFASLDGPPGSDKLFDLAPISAAAIGGVFGGTTHSVGSGTDFEASWLFMLGGLTGSGDFVVRWFTGADATTQQWDSFMSDLQATVRVGGSGGTVILQWITGTLNDSSWHQARVRVTYSGGNRSAELFVDGVSRATDVRAGTGGDGLSNFTVLTADTSGPTAVQGFGHLAGWAPPPATPVPYTAVLGYPGETATARLTRLGVENNAPVDVSGTSITKMGIQGVEVLLTVFRECEAADLGVLGDGRGPGCYYIARSSRYNASPALTVDASLYQVGDPFSPVDDDQRDRNLIKVDRKDGSSATVEDRIGPLGTAAIGTYDASTSSPLNLATDAPLTNIAAWLVHLGTVNEPYRYPALHLDFTASSELAAGWLATPIGGRIDITNVDSVATQHPTGTVSVLLEGYTESLSPLDWDVTANCSPATPWTVAALGVNFRLEMSGHSLASDLLPGATTLSLHAPVGADGHLHPFVQTADYPADFPVDLNVAGWRIHCTACVGATSPQVLTIDPAPNTIPLPYLTPVTLWKPAGLAL